MVRARAVLALTSAALALAACGSDDSGPLQRTSANARIADPGPVHIHGLGINPRDGALFIATHTGLFRSAPGAPRSQRVADRYQDTMGFTVVGPDEFLGSGHPDGRDNLPPYLGLIRSADAGKSWKPVSLLGKVDFHVLEADGDRVFGYGSDMETRQARFLTSRDGGRTWQRLRPPAPLGSLALAPGNPDHLLASGQRGLYRSDDAGRTWQRADGPAGLVAWTAEDWIVVDASGAVWSGSEDQEFARVGDIGGQPAALETAGDALYVALHDGFVKQSDDGGRNWVVRSRP